ncbi:hypothetical protein, partial [Pseudomonas asiatica]|uniref:hypothetical protein n=1 Tax=Pseudomonas asiatica TaxID=2219225 RepID=UPI0019D585CB
AYSASAKVICFMEKLGWRDRRISPDSGSLFQTFPSRGFCDGYDSWSDGVNRTGPIAGKPAPTGNAQGQKLTLYLWELACPQWSQ